MLLLNLWTLGIVSWDHELVGVRLTLFPFLVFVVGRRFWSKQLRKICGVFFLFAVVLASSALAKNRSELNGCRKTQTFEKALGSHASPESPLDAPT